MINRGLGKNNVKSQLQPPLLSQPTNDAFTAKHYTSLGADKLLFFKNL